MTDVRTDLSAHLSATGVDSDLAALLLKIAASGNRSSALIRKPRRSARIIPPACHYNMRRHGATKCFIIVPSVIVFI